MGLRNAGYWLSCVLTDFSLYLTITIAAFICVNAFDIGFSGAAFPVFVVLTLTNQVKSPNSIPRLCIQISILLISTKPNTLLFNMLISCIFNHQKTNGVTPFVFWWLKMQLINVLISPLMALMNFVLLIGGQIKPKFNGQEESASYKSCNLVFVFLHQLTIS